MKLAMRVQAMGKKVTLITTAFVLAVSTLTAAVPFILSQDAAAVSGYNYQNVTLNQANWTVDRQAPSGGWSTDPANARVIVNINQLNASSTQFNKTEGVSAPVASGSTSLTGSFYIAPDWAAKQGLRVGLWGVTNTPTSWPIVEYTANTDGYTGWRVWDTVNGGWTNVVASTNVGGSNSVEILLNPVTNKFNFIINGTNVASLGADGAGSFVSVILNHYNKGTELAADNYTVDWRNLRAGSAPTTSSCTTSSTVWSSTLDNWTPTDTRSAGHNVITGDGLRVYTDDASSQAKATGYRSVDYALSANGSQDIFASMDWAQTSGSLRPGLQLVVDFDNNGTIDGTLVGEPSYDQSWWLTNGSAQYVKDAAPRTGGGKGSNWFGTLNDWLTVYPTARVKAVGYSLGSGVQADGVIKSLSFGCVTYKFDNVAPAKPVHTSPANNGIQSSNNFWFDWNDVAGAARYEIQSSTDPAINPTTGSFQNIMWTGDYQRVQPTDSKAQSIGASGTWYWQVRAIDAAGNASEWTTPWKVTIDNQAPTLSITSLNDGDVFGGLESHSLQKKNIVIQATASDPNGLGAYCVKFTKVGSPEGTCIPGGYLYAPANGALTPATIDTTSLASGDYVIKARVTDKANNPSEVTRTISIDNTKPVITTNITEGQTLAGTVSIQLNTDELHPKIHNIRVIDANGATIAGLYDANATSPNATLAWNTRNPRVPNGTYKIQLSARDAVGNSATTVFRTVTVDNDYVAPEVAITSSSSSNTATPTITGTVNDSTARIFLSIGDNEAVEATNNADGTWSYVVPTALDEGEYALAVVAKDAFENVSEPATGTLTIAVTPTEGGGNTDNGETGTGGNPAPATQPQTATTATVTTTTPAITGPTAFAAILGANDAAGDTVNPSGAADVKGTSTDKKNLAAAVDANNTNGSALGFAWYWWLLILAAIATLIWWIIAAIRNRQSQA
jgi:hypothetical protein